MKYLFFTLLAAACLLFSSCAQQQNADQKFEALASHYIERLLETSPELATGLGDHRFDGKLSDYSAAGIEAQRSLTKSYLDSLSTIDQDDLDLTNQIDFQILQTNLESTLYSLDTLKEYEWNPLVYNVGGAIYGLLARDFAPVKERLTNVKSRLEGIPAVVTAAETNLKNPPKIHTETAIDQNSGTIDMIKNDLKMYLDQAPEMKKELAPAQAEAVKALEAYGRWMKTDLLPRSNGDFRIGDEKFKRKLYYSLESDLTKEEILNSAEEDLKKTQDTLYATALPLFKQMFPGVNDTSKLNNTKWIIRTVLDKLADAHPTNKTIVDDAKHDLQTATDFVRAHNLVTVPDKPVNVIVMPEYQRGIAVAYCDAPGPLEKNGETFFTISPTPKDWTKQRVESFYREYNNYMLQDLTIHEGMPGHYLQLAHANTFKAPTMVRAIFSNGAFIEGWATYAEQFMAENGYGGPEVKMEQQKMRLRLIINAIIDQKIHTAGMTEKEAMDLMMNEGFQEEGEAAGKWKRACLTSTQLSTYYVGNMELNMLRRAYQAKYPDADTKTMNDAIISVGSPAAKYVGEALGLE
ncbi:MAG TPA: DUF885 domain-containing protein [Bacteroidota bacterium]|nr:DUF885 domain-containing protein [Bacteroidota bacterium]